MERFVRQENVKRYREMLERAKTAAEREQLTKLLAEEEQKQMAAGDFDHAAASKPAKPGNNRQRP